MAIRNVALTVNFTDGIIVKDKNISMKDANNSKTIAKYNFWRLITQRKKT